MQQGRPACFSRVGNSHSSLRDLWASVVAMLGYAESILTVGFRRQSLSHSGEINVKNAMYVLHTLGATAPTLETADLSARRSELQALFIARAYTWTGILWKLAQKPRSTLGHIDKEGAFQSLQCCLLKVPMAVLGILDAYFWPSYLYEAVQIMALNQRV